MPGFSLKLAGQESLHVRSLQIREALSSLWVVTVRAASTRYEVALDEIVGQDATLTIASGILHSSTPDRTWAGVCSTIEQLHAESRGESTYLVRIVPKLWLLTQTKNNRVFQRESLPDIVKKVLGKHGIAPDMAGVHMPDYPKHDYRVQYNETDFAFVSRLLEEAGITYYFSHDGGETKLVLTDAPQTKKAAPPVKYVENPNEASELDFVGDVQLAHEVKPGKVTIRDFDFRRPAHELKGVSLEAKGREAAYEQYHYIPGSSLVAVDGAKDTPEADRKLRVRHHDNEAKIRADKLWEADRVGRRNIRYRTNLLGLSPGLVFSMLGHPRGDLGPSKTLLVTEWSFEGTPQDKWTMLGRAVFTDHHHRPAPRTPRPRVSGVQSAIVVGPSGQEIHTDEFGRVRVQFHWDREGKRNDESSCWIRVSQGWAGPGYGMINIPRIGHEVLVGFFDGDPDRPIVVGRVYNNTARVPYKLPDDKTKSTWKSDSSPSSDGFNEIMFEDKKGQELVYVQAERNLSKLVKVDEQERIGHNRTISVGVNRTASIGAVDSTFVGERHVIIVKQPKTPPPSGPPTRAEMVDKKITFTTGDATLVLDGADVSLDAKGTITIKAGADIIVQGRTIKLN